MISFEINQMFQKKYHLRSTGCFRNRNDIIWDQQAAPEKEMISFEINQMFQKKKWYYLRSTRCSKKKKYHLRSTGCFKKRNDIFCDQPDVSEKEIISFEINQMLQKKKFISFEIYLIFQKKNDIIWDIVDVSEKNAISKSYNWSNSHSQHV